MAELGTHLAIERAGVVTLHLRESAPQLYADYNCGLLKGQKCLLIRETVEIVFINILLSNQIVRNKKIVSTGHMALM